MNPRTRRLRRLRRNARAEAHQCAVIARALMRTIRDLRDHPTEEEYWAASLEQRSVWNRAAALAEVRRSLAQQDRREARREARRAKVVRAD